MQKMRLRVASKNQFSFSRYFPGFFNKIPGTKICMKRGQQNFQLAPFVLLLEHEQNKRIIKTMNQFLTKDNMNK